MMSGCHDGMMLWCHNVMVLWCHGIIMSGCHDGLMLRCHNVMVLWCHGIIMSWFYDVSMKLSVPDIKLVSLFHYFASCPILSHLVPCCPILSYHLRSCICFSKSVEWAQTLPCGKFPHFIFFLKACLTMFYTNIGDF